MEVQQPPAKIPRLSEGEEEHKRLVKLLEERIEKHDENRKAVQDKLREICDGLRAQINELEDRVNKELEENFIPEDNRLQAALNELRRNSTASALQKVRAELLVEQSYEIIENKKDVEDDYEEEYDEDGSEEGNDDDDEDGSEEGNDDDDYEEKNIDDDGSEESNDDDDEVKEDADEEDEDENDTVKPKLDLTTLYELKTEKRLVPELVKVRKPTNVRVTGVDRGRVSVQFTCLNPDEGRVLSDHTIVNPVKYKCTTFKKNNEQESKEEYPLVKNEGNDSSFTFTPDIFEAETTYGARVKIMYGDSKSKWSDDIAEFTTPEFKECCAWKKCPDDVYDDRKYSVDKKNPRVATSLYDNDCYCTIIGNTPIPLNTVTSWGIKILKSRNNDGDVIFVGVTPNDINQNDNNYDKCGWYLRCYDSELWSGPPHDYSGKEYGPEKEDGQYVHTGDSVGVVMDTTKGELSFVLNGVNFGVAYCGIPLDKPLVPCVVPGNKGDSVEFDTSEVRENVDSSVPVPSDIIAKSITWDSITLTWDEVVDASFYQIEVNGSISCGTFTTNTFTKRGLFPETEHSFRVRTMRGSSVSEWSDVVRGRTLKTPEFSGCVWKECPDDDMGVKYSVDEKNLRIATKISDDDRDDYCTIVGNTPVLLNTVTSWSIKILKSKDNDGSYIYIGIAPFDINQNDVIWNGWYFYCHDSILHSGPPHDYSGEEYGPRKEDGEYVQTGDSVGVVVDTTKGDLSFVLNGVNLGVAYEGIPLDKPLVPCVLFYNKDDSVELVI